MRKLILFAILIVVKTNAQTYFALPDSNTLWTIADTYSGWSRIIVKGDSLYGSYTYKKYHAVNDSNLSIIAATFLAIVR